MSCLCLALPCHAYALYYMHVAATLPASSCRAGSQLRTKLLYGLHPPSPTNSDAGPFFLSFFFSKTALRCMEPTSVLPHAASAKLASSVSFPFFLLLLLPRDFMQSAHANASNRTWSSTIQRRIMYMAFLLKVNPQSNLAPMPSPHKTDPFLPPTSRRTTYHITPLAQQAFFSALPLFFFSTSGFCFDNFLLFWLSRSRLAHLAPNVGSERRGLHLTHFVPA